MGFAAGRDARGAAARSRGRVKRPSIAVLIVIVVCDELCLLRLSLFVPRERKDTEKAKGSKEIRIIPTIERARAIEEALKKS